MFFLSLVIATDCDLVMSLAQGLNVHLVNPTLMNQVMTNCCTAPGISCTGSNVTGISWINKNLNGTINGTAIPTQLSHFALHINQIYGSIPNLSQFNFGHLYLLRNKLNGTIGAFPYRASDIRIYENSLTGSIPNYPNSLALFYGYDNKLTGDLPPMRPPNLQLYNNMLTGTIPTLLHGMRVFRLDGNLLSGIMPLIPSTLYDLRINTAWKYTNMISGTLSLNVPTIVQIFNCNFTAITIINNASLTNCDISYNPIAEQYTNNLPGCLQNGTGVNYQNFSELGISIEPVPSPTVYDDLLNIIETLESTQTSILYESSSNTTQLKWDLETIYNSESTSLKSIVKVPITRRNQVIKTSTMQDTTTMSSDSYTSASIAITSELESKSLDYIKINASSPISIQASILSILRVVVSCLFLIIIIKQLILRHQKKKPRQHHYSIEI